MSALSLQAMSLGLVAFMLIKVLAPAYYARKDTRTPVKIGIIAMVVNMVLNLLLVFPLMYYMNAGHMGLALATTLAAYLNAGLLLRGLLRDGVYRVHGGWRSYSLRLGLATAGMTATLVSMAHPTAEWLGWDWQRRALEMGLLCGAGVVAYLGIHVLLGTRLRHLRTPSEL
jgi:putative peptidoglycan lipid II flippase